MGEVAGAAGDGTPSWDERLGWAYGLISDDPDERAAALRRLDSGRKVADEAQARASDAWHAARALGLDSAAHWREPGFRRAREECDRLKALVLPDALWDGGRRGDGGTAAWAGLPYALLFLEWEARYPAEWTLHAKAWGTKEALVRDLAAPSVVRDPLVRDKLIDLIEIVVKRAHRCKDRVYVSAARAVDGDDLRGRLDRARRSDDPWARLHAGYVLWLLDRPELPNTRHVWRTWLAMDTAP
ncbi:hypothetical protein [Streptomyces fructofermentans]|uniref:Uncharacterized protein n=1 Tax=Streptomyces fructofermentans TaxID=152141 RepID=A0A918NR59_9ACTN|nr:hypothetical protein [Streptomyces fructofermentans]GGX89410.1 hypothetical protein GCM10010515_65790 [Streptomyces fructofermentans]